ncbi:hypothetical protein Tco_0926730 [Tanacetum coccineum]|uniref:Uncharacterized protein n=1 Tax=Tanacetum coccineum TaxID=301880 RepID=A0ABQ5DAM4_9ASTR
MEYNGGDDILGSGDDSGVSGDVGGNSGLVWGSFEVRIRQKSQENRQKWANTDTRTEECARAGSQIVPADNVPAGRSSSIPADYVSAGHVLVPADSDRIC